MVEVMTGELWAVAGEASAAAGAIGPSTNATAAVFAALRARFRECCYEVGVISATSTTFPVSTGFVVSLNDPGFLAANLAGFQTALSNRFSRNSTNPLLPRRPYSRFPEPQSHPFQV